MLAAEVLPSVAMQSTTRSPVDPEALGERRGDPRVGLVEDEQVELVRARRPPRRTRSSETSPSRADGVLEGLVAVHPQGPGPAVDRDQVGAASRRRRITNGADAALRVPPITSAPAPSPNTAAVLRSSGSR